MVFIYIYIDQLSLNKRYHKKISHKLEKERVQDLQIFSTILFPRASSTIYYIVHIWPFLSSSFFNSFIIDWDWELLEPSAIEQYWSSLKLWHVLFFGSVNGESGFWRELMKRLLLLVIFSCCSSNIFSCLFCSSINIWRLFWIWPWLLKISS